jgi:hypothetical protein
MADEQKTDEENVQALYLYAANSLRDGMPTGQIINKLVERGASPEFAEAIVHELQEAIIEAHKSEGRKNMLYGGLWCGGGTLVTVLSYAMAEGGGSFVLAWGAIIFGGIQFLRGAMQTAKN